MNNKHGLFLRFTFLVFCLCLSGGITLAQKAVPKGKKEIIHLGPDFLNNIQAKVKALSGTHKAADAIGSTGASVEAAAPANPTISSVPIFQASFDFQGTTFPYIMVGHRPSSGRLTHVNTVVLPVILVFHDFVDSNGNPFPFSLDPTGIVQPFINSPIFETANFANGSSQYGDAIQRAEFFKQIKGDWHVFVNNPEILKPIVVDVPGFAANIVEIPGGTLFGVIDQEFWQFEINTIVQLADFKTNEFAIILTQDMVIAAGADAMHNPIALGFHEATPVSFNNNVLSVQTFTWGSWMSSTALGGAFADILPLSHETAEFLNDPFLFNPVPPFQVPGAPPGTCQGNLEVGDPLAGSPFPVLTDGFVYHPQNVVLLQWFERKVPSDAFDGAYSFPDTTVVTSPPPVCVPAAASAGASK